MKTVLIVLTPLLFLNCTQQQRSSNDTNESEESVPISHSFFVAGPNFTGIIDESGKVEWDAGRPGARDGYVLSNGNILICWSDEVIEYTRDKQVVFNYNKPEMTKELGAVVRLENGNTLITESGDNPRLVEVNPAGEIEVEVPLVPELWMNMQGRYNLWDAQHDKDNQKILEKILDFKEWINSEVFE